MTAVNGGREVLASNCGLDYVLHVANVDSVSGGSFAVYFYFKVWSTGDALGIEISDTRNRAQSPFDRVATPEEVAAAVVYLASPEAEWASGAVLDLNGASYLR